MKRTQFSAGRRFMGRLPKGTELVEALTRIVNDEEIKTGTIALYGYLENVVFVRKDLETGFDEPEDIAGPLLIGSMSGTISLFKRRALPQISGVLVKEDGGVVAGTVGPGTRVHACEVVIEEVTGGTLSRDFDQGTGLALWKANSLLIEPDGDG